MPTRRLGPSFSQLHPAEFARMLGEWVSGERPLYRDLATKLQVLIDEGDLVPDSLLPPERALADALVVSRTTVSAAYEELRNRRLVESRRGSGTWVRARDVHHNLLDQTRSFPWPNLLRPSPPKQEPKIPEMVGLRSTDMAASPALTDGLAKMTPADWLAATTGEGYSPAGLAQLRDAIARDLSERGLTTSPEELLITTGAQQAYQLVVSAFVKPGARVVLEDPTYAGALTIFESARARLLPVRLDEQGMDVEQARRLGTTKRVALIYVIPTYHNPTGVVMSAQRRQDLVRLAHESNVPIMESLALHDIPISNAATPPPMGQMNRKSVISVGSLSSLFWAGLRIGWLRAPKRLLSDLKRLKASRDLGTPLLDQFVAARLMADIDTARAQRIAELRQRYVHMTARLTQAIPEWSWSEPAGGASLWVQLPFGSATQYVQVAARHGVAVLPGPAFSPSGACDDRIRVPFVLDEPKLDLAVDRLHRAWRDYSRGSARRGAPIARGGAA